MRFQRDIESCVQMRLYTWSSRKFLLLYASGLLVLLIALAVGLTGPKPITTESTTLLRAPATNLTGPFVIHSPFLSVFNQELWLALVVVLDKRHEMTGLVVPLNATVSAHVHFQTTELSTENSFELQAPIHLPVTLRCSQLICDQLLLAHIVPIDFASYTFTIRLSNGPDTIRPPASLVVSETQFLFHYVSTQFTYVEVFSRFACVLVSVVCTVFFLGSLRKFPFQDWTLEQKFTSLLLLLLIFFNDPMYPLRFFTKGPLVPALGCLFQVTFGCTLLAGWLCLYHGMRASKRSVCKFYLPKIVLVGFPGLLYFAFAVSNLVAEYSASPLTTVSEHPLGVSLGITMAIFLVVYVLLFIILCYRAHIDLGKFPFYALRLRTLTTLSTTVMIITVICLSASFEATHMLWQAGFSVRSRFLVEPHSIPSVTWSPGRGVVVFLPMLLALMNTYTVILVVLYSPSKHADRDTTYKDNPLLSMLNESDDEDVIYNANSGAVRLAVTR